MFKCLSKKIHTHLFKTKNKKSFAFIKYVDLKKRKNNFLFTSKKKNFVIILEKKLYVIYVETKNYVFNVID